MKLSTSILLLLSFAIALPATSQAAIDESQVVLIANYHASFRAGSELRQMKGQAKVRNTSQFPIQFDDFRILILLIRIAEKEYKADVVLERLEESKWLPINTDAVSFRSFFASPAEFEWTDDQYSPDLAIAVSVLSE